MQLVSPSLFLHRTFCTHFSRGCPAFIRSYLLRLFSFHSRPKNNLSPNHFRPFISSPSEQIGKTDSHSISKSERDSEQNNKQLTRAVDKSRFGEGDERTRVGGEDASQQDVAQLPARGHDDRGPVVEDEDHDDLQGHDDPQGGEEEGEEDPGTLAVEGLGLHGQALVLLRRGGVPDGTLVALVLPDDDRVLPAGHAAPATGVLQEREKGE